jgi:hypothetical protein
VTFGLGSAAEPKFKYIHGVAEKRAFILTGKSIYSSITTTFLNKVSWNLQN